MSYETGDVIVWDGSPGHVGMVLEPAAGRTPASIIHARLKTNFAIESQTKEDGNKTFYLIDNNANLFRPPWDRCGDTDGKKRELIRIARAMSRTAKYGVYRAIRLWAGSSIYGPKAHQRLQKYRDRAIRNFQDAHGNDKFVTTVTCAEAIILCYQLTFADGTEPFFIRLDGAHAMPKTLAEWLGTNWGRPSRG
jgi:hypothetical protein